jgi:hypothetical protein
VAQRLELCQLLINRQLSVINSASFGPVIAFGYLNYNYIQEPSESQINIIFALLETWFLGSKMPSSGTNQP